MSLAGTATMVGSVLGTPQYMSPEQARGEIDAQDERSDIYSLGAILYQILALRPPVSGDDPNEIIDKVRDGKIEPLRASRAQRHWPIPESLAAVAMKALAMDPADRAHERAGVAGGYCCISARVRYGRGACGTAQTALSADRTPQMGGSHSRGRHYRAGWDRYVRTGSCHSRARNRYTRATTCPDRAASRRRRSQLRRS